jgi:hypothetical protein
MSDANQDLPHVKIGVISKNWSCVDDN